MTYVKKASQEEESAGMNLDALFSINCGMYVISSFSEEKKGGCIVNAVVQVTAFPPQVIASLNKESYTQELIKKSGYFGISVLEKDTPLQIIGLFGFKSCRNFDKFAEVKHFKGKTGVSLLSEYSVAYLEAKVTKVLDAGTHSVFLGEVIEADFLDPSKESMTYNYYRDVKGGKVPRTAATYHEGEETAVVSERYRCKVCGYIYDSRFGDPDSGIDPNTPFAELPEDWVCPICGAGKDQFEKL